MNQSTRSLRSIRWLLGLFIAGLVFSGVTAIPLVTEVDFLTRLTGANELLERSASTEAPAWARWLTGIQRSLHATAEQHPALFYGTDWLAFGHIVIAIAFIGAWRDPVRNSWLIDFGLIACALVIPWALVFGHLRGIPLGWRLIDCSFGVLGAVPLYFCKQLIHDHTSNSFPASTSGDPAPIR